MLYAIITMVPLVWILMTSFKSPPDSISYPPKVFFSPTIEGYCNLLTTRSRQTPEYLASLPPPSGTFTVLARKKRQRWLHTIPQSVSSEHTTQAS